MPPTQSWTSLVLRTSLARCTYSWTVRSTERYQCKRMYIANVPPGHSTCATLLVSHPIPPVAAWKVLVRNMPPEIKIFCFVFWHNEKCCHFEILVDKQTDHLKVVVLSIRTQIDNPALPVCTVCIFPFDHYGITGYLCNVATEEWSSRFLRMFHLEWKIFITMIRIFLVCNISPPNSFGSLL